MSTALARLALVLLLAGALLLPSASLARTITGQVNIEQGTTVPLGKFSFRPSGTQDNIIEGTILFAGEARGELYLFMDTEWEKYHRENDACQRMRHATSKLEIGEVNFHTGKGAFQASLGNERNGMRKEWKFKWSIEHHVRTYGYYLVLGDCRGGGRRFKGFQYDIKFLNPGGDHFPADEHGLFTMYIICFLLMVGFGVTILMPSLFGKQKNRANRDFDFAWTGPPTAAIALLTVAYVCWCFSLFSEILHLWWYSYNGYGIFAFDFLSELGEGLSQTCISYLLISLACGWTLIEGAVTSKTHHTINPEALGEDNFATVLLFLIVVGTVVLQLLNKLVFADEFLKFHDHETWPGMLQVCVRVVMAGVFSYQAYRTVSYQSRKGNGRMLQFMKGLAFFGGAYLWCFPALVLIAGLFAHYLRHRVVTGGVLFLQTAALLALTRQITRETSAYAKVSVHGGTLPTGARGV